MKPGEYIGSDGRAHNVRSIMLGELDDACNSATVQMDGGAWLTYKKHLVPHHPDFPLAVAALQSLLPKPTVHPAVGLRYCEEPINPTSCSHWWKTHQEADCSGHYPVHICAWCGQRREGGR